MCATHRTLIDRAWRHLVARSRTQTVNDGIHRPSVARLRAGGDVQAAVKSRVALPAVADCLEAVNAAATIPTVPVLGGSYRWPRGQRLEVPTWLEADAEEWRGIAMRDELDYAWRCDMSNSATRLWLRPGINVMNAASSSARRTSPLPASCRLSRPGGHIPW